MAGSLTARQQTSGAGTAMVVKIRQTSSFDSLGRPASTTPVVGSRAAISVLVRRAWRLISFDI